MKNWRKILVVGMVAGMVAVTGCSSNVPETNQGNRNGQRVVDAVNRRTDSYGLNRAYNTGVRTVRGFNRGFRRAARNDGAAGTRHYNHVAHPGVKVDNNSQYRHPGIGTGTARNTPNRSTNALNRGRIGHTFGYDQSQYGHMNGVDNEHGGYDLGQRAGIRASNSTGNTANLNNRVVRSTPARNVTNHNRTANTGNNVTRKSGVTRSNGTNATHKPKTVTRNTTAKAVQPTHVKPNATPAPNAITRSNGGNVTHPMLHNTHNVGKVTHTAPGRPVVNRQVTPNQTARTEGLRGGLHPNTKATHLPNANTAPAAPIMNANPIVNPSATRGITRARSLNSGQNRSERRAVNRKAENGTNRRANRVSRRPNNVNINDYNLAHRGLNNSMYLGPDFYMSNNDANGMYGGLPFTGHNSVPASTTDDSGDYAFFKRNKTNDDVPATPAPPSGPQIPNRSNQVNPPVPTPAPAPVNPAPTSMASSWSDNAYDDNIHDLEDSADYNYDSDYLNPIPAQFDSQRVMK